MTAYICVQCGVQFAASTEPPRKCAICEDERQFRNWMGQIWTTLEDLRRVHHNVLREAEPGLTSISTEPAFGIGQQALLVETDAGNVLWDCLSLVDDETVHQVEERGGLATIAISHPHFYDSMVEWSRAFGGVPVYLHAADREWVMRPDPSLVFWEGETQDLGGGLTLIHCGGHFAGSAVLHWPGGAADNSALLTSDTLHVTADLRHVTFMRSFPNLIPLSGTAIRAIVEAVGPYRFDRLYGGFFDRTIVSGAKAAIQRSVERYLEAIAG